MTKFDFNPRPREEGDVLFKPDKCDVAISIHALVKRATKTTKTAHKGRRISIHALVKRATTIAQYKPCENGISIHALVKRATCKKIP